MGAKCCSDRKATNGQDAPQTVGAKPDRKSVHAGNAYDTKKRAISLGYSSKGDDAEKFDKAFEATDIKAFVGLLTSKQLIESFDERMHPWAEDPKTVGALAGTQLAILASVAERDNPNVKKEIGEAGAIPLLVGFLRSEENDRIQTAVVALSFLTSECPGNCVSAFDAGAMPLLIKHLDSPMTGMRLSSATSLRNICVENDDFRKAFVDQGGIRGLVGLLDMPPEPSLNHDDVQLESILNLQDTIERMEEGGSIIEEYALLAVDAGAEAKLKKLLSSADEEVRSSAQELLDCLAMVKRNHGRG